MTITIPSGRTLPLQAKAGGGFESSGVPGDVAQGLIFDPDFDTMPDWEIQHEGQRYIWVDYTGDDGTLGTVAKNNIPTGFDFYYSGENWHPAGDKNGAGAVPGNLPIGQINSDHGGVSGPSGKAFIINDESYGGPSQWGADMVLVREFNTHYQELFVEIKIKYDPNWIWQSDGTPTGKILRIGRFSGGDLNSRFSFNTGDGIGPLSFCDLKLFNGRARIKGAYRSDPYADIGFDEEYAETGGLTFAQQFQTASWVTIAVYMKANSAVGVSDGIYRVWVDGNQRINNTAINWNRDAGAVETGFNYVGIGGNTNNVWDLEANQSEQWYAIGQVRVYDGVPEAYV